MSPNFAPRLSSPPLPHTLPCRVVVQVGYDVAVVVANKLGVVAVGHFLVRFLECCVMVLLFCLFSLPSLPLSVDKEINKNSFA